MKRFLPTLPAFLLCLFGGMYSPWHPWPKTDAQIGVPAMVGWLPNQEEGYQEWVKQCEGRAKQAANNANKNVETAKLKSEEDTAKAVLKAVQDCESKVDDVAALAKIKQEAEKITGPLINSKQELDGLAKAQQSVANEAFVKRAEWLKTYINRYNSHVKSLTQDFENLKGFATRANALKEQPKEPKASDK